MASTQTKPRTPREPSDEATEEQLRLANEQGHQYKKALEHMTEKVADDGGEVAVGDYLVAYAVEKAEGMYMSRGGELEWQEPAEDENAHIEIAVRDGADGRFLPGLEVQVTVLDAEGKEVGTHMQPFLWHPWLFHYGRNWHVPGDGTYGLRVRIEPPTFMRHDRKNGKRYTQPEVVEFNRVRIETGQE
ncbi:MAG: iron transporter [Actinobacteria bacterium]|nr:iron transporter [Actinomycetota bacterium]